VSETKVLGFAGSARADSFNKRLVAVALEGAAETGCTTTLVDLADFRLPLYDGDFEASNDYPESAARLRALLLEHQGLLIASPEYNGSITPLLKNTLDWVSRSPERRPDLSPYQGKVAALLAASPGPLGGLRGLPIVRALLSNLGVTTLANQVSLRAAHEHFDGSGAMTDQGTRDRVRGLGRELALAARRLAAD
jgi:NAD(P)H-dependent FMN reductase